MSQPSFPRYRIFRKYILITFSFIILLLFARAPDPKYYLSISAIFRNEARFLREWIEYHRIIGVEHFYLFDNLSEDNYEQVLKPYIAKRIVELFQWPYKAQSQKEWTRVQCAAYTDIIKKKGPETFWLAIIDTDEFILPLQTKSLSKFLKDYEECSGIGINWQLFGTSSVKYIPKNKTLIGSLTKRADTDFSSNRFIKTIFQPKRVRKIKQPHFCKYKKPYFHVNENKAVFSSHSLTTKISVDKIRINHYTYRDETFFHEEKLRRLQMWSPGAKTQMNPKFNEVEDKLILYYLPELKKRLFGVGSDASIN